jgi:hypothetical protein
MSSVNLNTTGYAGKTSLPASPIPVVEPGCRRCGSSLVGRLEAVHRDPGVTLFIWRCGCGRCRRLRREAAAR